MKNVLPHLAAMFVVSCLICGCTFEDETEEKIVTPNNVEVEANASNLNGEQSLFLEKTKQCILGKSKDIDDIVNTYFSSLDADDNPKNSTLSDADFQANRLSDPKQLYQYQVSELNSSYENCIQKAISDNLPQYSDDILTRSRVCAKISQHYYEIGNTKEGAYWQLRVLNLAGLSQGYYVLGITFVQKENTLKSGAQFLAESAKLGNASAEQYLNDNAVFLNVFDKLSVQN